MGLTCAGMQNCGNGKRGKDTDIILSAKIHCKTPFKSL